MSTYANTYNQDKTQKQLQKLADKLNDAIEKLKEQDEFIQQVAAAPMSYGIIVDEGTTLLKGKNVDTVDLFTSGGVVRLPVNEDYNVGDHVLYINGQGIVERVDHSSTGPAATYKAEVSETTAEVIAEGGRVGIVYCSSSKWTLEEGDRIQLDPSGSVVVAKLENVKPVAKPVTSRVTWDQIGGHAEAKLAIEQAIVWPLVHAKLVTAYGQRPSKGVLFYGPPGCGKTLLAKATATALADKGDPGFFSVRGPELMNPYVGETERAIRELFRMARKHSEEFSTRAVIFIDEADSCLGHRGHSIHNDISVPAFLVEMDGMADSNNPLVILATNRPNDLDSAIVREGRIDRRIKIDRPGAEDVVVLFELYLKSRPVAGDLRTTSVETATAMAQTPLWSNRSGAMIAALVDRATANAMNRDITIKCSKPSGINLDDCLAAVNEAASQHRMAV